MLPCVRVHTYIAESGVLPHLPVRTNLAYYVLHLIQSVIYDLVADAFITGEDRHVILASVA